MDDKARITALESLVAHQQAALDDLSAELAKQWEQIDRLNLTVKKIYDQTSDHARALNRPEGDVKPPHY